MKTTLSELIEKIDEHLSISQNHYTKRGITIIKKEAEKLLLKEQQQIISAFDSGAYAGSVKADISGHQYLINKFKPY